MRIRLNTNTHALRRVVMGTLMVLWVIVLAARGSVSVVDAATADDLSEDEVAGLRFMREEEKLARDVYLTLYEQWEMSIFQNIARSEQRHMDAIGVLLARYDLEDPAAGRDIGEFTDEELQALYDELIATGSTSLEDALRVGAAIEEIDILDLEERIPEADHADIVQVYENLLRGSRNHLRAFTRTQERETGETYTPQYLDQETYAAIVSGGVERGRGMGRGRGRGGVGRGGRGRGGTR
ncbi:MAG: DUF2202 domain-containing protein [Anaerolineae bacterium]